MAKRILVLGGDGFCGWPTALRLSAQGYQVDIVDNLSRRNIDNELCCESLTPIRSISRRLQTWQQVSGNDIGYYHIDIATQPEALLQCLCDTRPDAIVHFAEQRAAPYSMKSSWHKRYTVDNNVSGTNNLLAAVVESGLDIHIVHLGTMGVYGYGRVDGAVIPEGYLPVQIETEAGWQQTDILHPADPGSLYHTTKTIDQLLFYFYNKNDNLRITDLHQGVVWGTQTPETARHDDLINRFDYDGDYGTVLNRFLMQAAIGHPLTVYGSGGQTRAFIHLRDTVRCIQLAIENPPQTGARVDIFNQVTEIWTVAELAQKVAAIAGAEIRHYQNPRKEAAHNRLEVERGKFQQLGLNPTTLDAGLLEEVVDIARRFRERCDEARILPSSRWTKNQQLDSEGTAETAPAATVAS
ncbi:MAG: NAD-dependent epimerase/dehydratase family protein [Gammaproteobacteria bacterium]|jgi:UDP-sulfoquinovose synthase|nr:NAD-dependent epimerase/dehydratase family protein [Gammaproteobacteria bacterium]